MPCWNPPACLSHSRRVVLLVGPRKHTHTPPALLRRLCSFDNNSSLRPTTLLVATIGSHAQTSRDLADRLLSQSVCSLGLVLLFLKASQISGVTNWSTILIKCVFIYWFKLYSRILVLIGLFIDQHLHLENPLIFHQNILLAILCITSTSDICYNNLLFFTMSNMVPELNIWHAI